MKMSITRWVATAMLALVLAGCGGSSGDSSGTPPPPSGNAVRDAINAAARVPANDSATSSSSAFTVVRAAGVPFMTVPATGAATVNFVVISDGAVKPGLNQGNLRFAIAKLVPGVNGEIDRWQSYVSTTELTGAPGSPNHKGPLPGGAGDTDGAPVLAQAQQATTDPRTAASFVPPCGGSVTTNCNAGGYYTYTFTTNLRNPAQTNGVVFDPNATHRIAIQLGYTNAAGETVRVNPYIDVTFDANGNAVPVTDPAKTRVMADVASCNGCHERLALHGGGRVDVQYCVMCHNPGTTDANSGNVLTMQTMVHKLHAGRLLNSQIAAGGEQYVIWGFNSEKHDYSEVGFPQDLRNCTVCHTAANPKTPQGDNWKSRPSKESCLTCHANSAGSSFVASHTGFAIAIVGPGAVPRDIPNASCAECHRPGASVSPERVHFNQNEEHSAKYKVNIDSVTFDAGTRVVRVRFNVSDPTNGNAKYNLVTSDCTVSGGVPTCANTTRFGNLRFYLAYPNLPGQSQQVTEFTSRNNGGSDVNAFMYRGINDGSNNYTIDLTLPADSATMVAAGTARVIGIGQVKEPRLLLQSAADPRPVDPNPPTGKAVVNVVVQHTFADVVLSGTLNPRRQVVSNDKCNVCHGALGTTTGSNTRAEAFHSGARNTVEACALCHDALRFSSTVMTNGRALSENYSFKRMIHGIHGNSKRTYPFTHDNAVIGEFGMDGLLLANGFAAGTASTAPLGTAQLPFATATLVPAGTPLANGVLNYAAEVAYPQVGLNCNACHVNNSWQDDRSAVGAVVAKPLVGAATPLATDPNPLNWLVISPKAATCTGCHDSQAAISHVTGFGGASFGTQPLGQQLNGPRETCNDCHRVGEGLPFAVDQVHRLR